MKWAEAHKCHNRISHKSMQHHWVHLQTAEGSPKDRNILITTQTMSLCLSSTDNDCLCSVNQQQALKRTILLWCYSFPLQAGGDQKQTYCWRLPSAILSRENCPKSTRFTAFENCCSKRKKDHHRKNTFKETINLIKSLRFCWIDCDDSIDWYGVAVRWFWPHWGWCCELFCTIIKNE